MKIIQSEKFTEKGKNYEIRVFLTNNGYLVQAFHNNKRANNYTYSVDFDTSLNFEWDKGYEAFQHLIEIAKSDIKSGMWEKYLAARAKA